VGGKAVIPKSFPDGTSNTIGYFERYAVCGDSTKAWGSGITPGTPPYCEHIWGEDGQNVGPIAQSWNNNAWMTPSWWVDTGVGSPGQGFDDPGRLPNKYPYDWIVNPTAHGLPTTFLRPFQESPNVLGDIKDPRTCYPTQLQSFSAGGLQVLMVDGSVRVVSPGVSLPTWASAIIPNDGRTLGNDW
jgi:hypothetical protein